MVGADILVLCLIVGGAFTIGIIGFTVILPLLSRFAFFIEITSLVSEALGSYFGRPGLFQIGCLIVFASLFACCCMTVILSGAFFTCFTENPVNLCRLIGR